MNKILYHKPWLDITAQLQKLKDRGLMVNDDEVAKKRLAYINYYRFAGYSLRLQHKSATNGDRFFNDNISFDYVWGLCLFDRDLRDVFSEALELVEISLRSNMVYYFAKVHGPFGHTEPSNFDIKFSRSKDCNASPFHSWIDIIHTETRRSNEIFVDHFKKQYAQYPDLPIWMIGEICSFGTLSKMYTNMLNVDQSKIAAEYNVQYLVLQSWMHSLTYVRNVCAHHARLWDKMMKIPPKLPRSKNWRRLLGQEKTVFVMALILNWLLAHDSIDVDAHKSWKLKFEQLIDNFVIKYPSLLPFTGFNKDWKKNPLWWQY